MEIVAPDLSGGNAGSRWFSQGGENALTREWAVTVVATVFSTEIRLPPQWGEDLLPPPRRSRRRPGPTVDPSPRIARMNANCQRRPVLSLAIPSLPCRAEASAKAGGDSPLPGLPFAPGLPSDALVPESADNPVQSFLCTFGGVESFLALMMTTIRVATLTRMPKAETKNRRRMGFFRGEINYFTGGVGGAVCRRMVPASASIAPEPFGVATITCGVIWTLPSTTRRRSSSWATWSRPSASTRRR